jgi:hypothetical protein
VAVTTSKIHTIIHFFRAFGLARYARFSFALGDDDLREGINRLASFVNG